MALMVTIRLYHALNISKFFILLLNTKQMRQYDPTKAKTVKKHIRYKDRLPIIKIIIPPYIYLINEKILRRIQQNCSLFVQILKKLHSFQNGDFYLSGGRTGIRTLAGLASSIGFQDRPLQPLGYSSIWWAIKELNFAIALIRRTL